MLETIMGLNIDTSSSLRSSNRLDRLIHEIYHADANTPETHWLEWKSSLDLDVAKGKVTAAKAIIAFANRDPVNAARECGGEAYLVVGVSPGGVVNDLATLDGADLAGKLKTYVDGPHWDVDYVLFQNHNILVITVAPPLPGNEIHSLVKDYENYKSGTVFRRGVSSSEPATHRELNELQRRLLQPVPVSGTDAFTHAIDSNNVAAASRLMRSAVRNVIGVTNDPAGFPATFVARSPADQLDEYVEIADRYLAAASPVITFVVEGCRVEAPSLEREWRQTVSALAEPRPLSRPAGSLVTTGRDERLEALALLPTTLVMYGGAIAAVDHENYGAVRALTTDGAVDRSVWGQGPQITVLEKAGPWELVANERQLGVALRAGQQGKLTDELRAALAAGRVPRRPSYPVSAYLFDALRPYFSDHTDSQYKNLFDYAELLFSLIAADLISQKMPYLEQPWLGLFAAHAAESYPFENTEVSRILAIANDEGADWAPLQAGLFDGSETRLRSAVQAVHAATVEYCRRMPY